MKKRKELLSVVLAAAMVLQAAPAALAVGEDEVNEQPEVITEAEVFSLQTGTGEAEKPGVSGNHADGTMTKVGQVEGQDVTVFVPTGFTNIPPSNASIQKVNGTDEGVTWAGENWYLVSGEVSIGAGATVTENVNLILADNAHLTVNGGIQVASGNQLTIWGQKGGTGKLTAIGKKWGNAGIGGRKGEDCGTVTINGGIIEAIADLSAGIGGGYAQNQDTGCSGGMITINSGTVEASSAHSAGIGGGGSSTSINYSGGGPGGKITINGGMVTATTSDGAGIGGGSGRLYGGSGGTITINGGTVTATASGNGAGIGGGYGSNGGSGGKITINGGTVTASSGRGAGIGTSMNYKNNIDGGTITIDGGTVTASSTQGAGIGLGSIEFGYNDDINKVPNGKTYITGGTVTASSVKGAGIGSGSITFSSQNYTPKVPIGNVTINGGTVIASSTKGAGIGAGSYSFELAENGKNMSLDGKFSMTGGTGLLFAQGSESAGAITSKDNQESWAGVVFEGNNGQVYGAATPEASFEIAANQSLTVGKDSTLALSDGVTLTNNGTLTNCGTISPSNATITGQGKFYKDGAATEANIVPPSNVPTQMVYTGNAFATAADFKLSATEFGQTWEFPGWTGALTKDSQLVTEIRDAGEYTITFSKGENSVSKEILVKQSATAFTEGVKAYDDKGNVAQKFTYGDTVTVKAKPGATGEAVSMTSLMAGPSLFALSAPTPRQMALYLGDTQISDPAEADESGIYTMTCSTQSLAMGSNTITAKFVGDANMADAESNVTVTVAPKTLRAADFEAIPQIAKAYDGTADCTTSSMTLKVKPGALVFGDTNIELTASGASAFVGGVNAKDKVTVTFTTNADTISGDGKYKLASGTQITGISGDITPAPITPVVTSVAAAFFTGETLTPTLTLKTAQDGVELKTTDFAAEYSNNINASAAAEYTVAAKPDGNYSFEPVSGSFTIAPHAPLALTAEVFLMKNQPDYTVTLDLSKAVNYPANPGGTPAFTVKTAPEGSETTATVEGSQLTLVADNETRTEDSSVVINLTNMTNYENSTITVTVKYTDKQPVNISGVTVADRAYNGTPITCSSTPTAKKQNDQTVVTPSAYTYTWQSANGASIGQAPTAPGTYTLVVAVDDEQFIGSVKLPVTISKATVTIKADDKSAYVGDQEPEYTYTVSGLAQGEQLGGKVTITDNADMTKAGSYTITPAGGTVPNGENYNEVIVYNTGTLTVTNRPAPPSSGGYTPTPRPETQVNPDGSKTETVTKPDGTKVETTENPNGDKTVVETRKDGSSVKTEEKANGDKTVTETKKDGTTVKSEEKANGDKAITEIRKDGSSTKNEEKANGDTLTTETAKDGSSVIEAKKPDGTTAKATTDTEGVTKAETKVSEKAVETAVKENKPIELPLPPVKPAEQGKENASVIKVELPRTEKGESEEIRITIPVEDPKPGTVAVIVHKDGTEEIVRKTGKSENGVTIPLEEGALIKIVDNTKHFDDVPDTHWGKDEITSAVANEIFNGTDTGDFMPDEGMSRGMLAVVLHNLERNPEGGKENFGDVDPDKYYAAAIGWAAEVGIVSGNGSGFAPDDTITREQLATILWRFAGSPSPKGGRMPFTDARKVADWAAYAMQWAVESGIITGIGNDMLNPQGTATRAQVAAMLMRFLNR